MKYFISGFLTVLAIFVFVGLARAVAVEKIVWCHTEPNGNQQTLELPQAALENAGHVNASGNPLHAGDHAGVCVELTPTPTLSPTVTPTPTVVPSVTPTPTTTPEVTPTPTDTPNQGGPGDGKSDGLGCGSHDCSVQGVSAYDGRQVGWK